MDPNTKKQRAELKEIKSRLTRVRNARAGIKAMSQRAESRLTKTLSKKIAALNREHKVELKAIRQEERMEGRIMDREEQALLNRKAVLEGRLN